MVATAYATERAPVLASPRMDKSLHAPTMATLRGVPLPMEALALKESIRKTHPTKCFAFSLLHLRKMAVPPVQIPAMYRTSRQKALQVGGREVPYTRLMWERTKRTTFPKGTLDTVREHGGIVAPSRHR